MRLVAAIVLTVSLMAGCAEDGTAAPPAAPDEPRTSDGHDDGAEWAGINCDVRDAGMDVPASAVRPLVPERFPISEFPPGVTRLFISATRCEALVIDGNMTLPDVVQARLEVFTSSSTLYVIEWIVPDDAVRTALANRGFQVKDGTVELAERPGLAGTDGALLVAVDGQERATVTWSHGDTPIPRAATYGLVQDNQGQDRSVAFWMETGPTANLPEDHCLATSQDSTWSAAMAVSPQPECFVQNASGIKTSYTF